MVEACGSNSWEKPCSLHWQNGEMISDSFYPLCVVVNVWELSVFVTECQGQIANDSNKHSVEHYI